MEQEVEKKYLDTYNFQERQVHSKDINRCKLIFVNNKISEDFFRSRFYAIDCIIGLSFILFTRFIIDCSCCCSIHKTIGKIYNIKDVNVRERDDIQILSIMAKLNIFAGICLWFNSVPRIQLFYEVNFLISSPVQCSNHCNAMLLWQLYCIIQNGSDLLL